MKTAHPDVAGDAEQFRLITQAYDVLVDPDRRAAYDRSVRSTSVIPQPARRSQPGRRPRYGRYAVLLVAAMLVGGVVWLVAATARRSVGDDCLVGTWRGEAFDVPFRAFLDGREIAAPIRGGAGVVLTVAADGTVRADYSEADPLVGTEGAYRIEGVYAGATTERWRAADGRVRQSGADTSGLRFRAAVNGRLPDQPVGVTVLAREYPYNCTATALELGPYRYVRI